MSDTDIWISDLRRCEPSDKSNSKLINYPYIYNTPVDAEVVFIVLSRGLINQVSLVVENTSSYEHIVGAIERYVTQQDVHFDVCRLKIIDLYLQCLNRDSICKLESVYRETKNPDLKKLLHEFLFF
jgi:hypothetical protein